METIRAFRALLRRNPDLRQESDFIEILIETEGVQPVAWRLLREGEAEGWGHEVLVLEVSTRSRSRRSLEPYEQLWWRMDASEAMHLRVYQADRRTKIMDEGEGMIRRLRTDN